MVSYKTLKIIIECTFKPKVDWRRFFKDLPKVPEVKEPEPEPEPEPVKDPEPEPEPEPEPDQKNKIIKKIKILPKK